MAVADKQHFVHVNGVNLNLVDAGTGSPTLLFLHFWGGSSRTWGPVIDLLSRDNRCLAVDFRGWGRSSKDADRYDLSVLADDVEGLVAALELTDFVIVGHSMGGKVAQILAGRALQGLKQLILIAPAPPTALQAPEEQRDQMLESYQSRDGAEQAIKVLTANPLPQSRRETVIGDILSGSPEAKRAWTENGMIEDISAQAARIKIAVHVVVGSADVVEPEPSLRSAFGKVIPRTAFTVIPGAGHLSPLEATTELAAAIRAAQAI